jgi:hypothetical protein
MAEKLQFNEILLAVNLNSKDVWKELDDDQKKALKKDFFLLNKLVSAVKSSDVDIASHYVLAVNEFFNKHWNTLQKHPQLLWQLLCLCGHESKRKYSHEWLKVKSKLKSDKINSPILKFLSELYPNMKTDELELLTNITSLDDAKELAKSHGYSDKEIAKMFK